MLKEKLYNKDGAELYIEETSNNNFIINCDDEHKWVLEYVTINFDGEYGTDTCKILSFDPSGGPYMMVNNFKLSDGRILDKIIWNNKDNKFEFNFK